MSSRIVALAAHVALAGLLWSQRPDSPDDAEALHAAELFEAIPPGPPPPVSTQSGMRSLASQQQSGKLDPRIAQTIERSGSSRSVAGSPPVKAIIEAETTAVIPALRRRLEGAGYSITASFENVAYTILPASAAPSVAAWQEVRSIRIQDEYYSAQAGTSSSSTAAGLDHSGLETLRKFSLTGKKVRVGILDHGFAGLDALIQSGRVRRPIKQQAFPASHGIQNENRHGTACAEIIAGIAPDAELYLASFDGYEGNLIAAAEWLISQGVRIISYSGGNPAAPSDASDPLSRFIDRSTSEKQVLWVISSGNTADRHWSGMAIDSNGDGWIDINGTHPYLTIIPLQPKVSITIRWNDWGADPRRPLATQDLDAQLVELDKSGKATRVVAHSRRRQQGAAARPVEWLKLDGKEWIKRRLAIMLQPVSVKRKMLVHVFVESDTQMVPRSPARSVLSPSAARMAVSVGGFDMVREQLALYSAQGPTDDNRLKPELVAPTNVPSTTYVAQGGRFAGTSASSPHASGLAALLFERFRPATAMQLRTLLLQASAPLGNPRPNSLYGYGQLDASRARPAPTSAKSRGLGIGSVTLTEDFGGEISFAQLDKFREAGMRQDLFTGRITTDRTLYQIGDPVSVSFSVNAPGVCALLHRDSAGKYTALIAGVKVEAGEAVATPAMEAAEPVGREELLLLCVAKTVNLAAIDPQEALPEVAVASAIFDIVSPFL